MMYKNWMKKLCLAVLITGLLGLLSAPSRVSAITLGFQPSQTTILTGDMAWIDVVVTDLGSEIVSAYDLYVTYDASIASVNDVVFGSGLDLGVPGSSFQSFDILTSPGTVNIAELTAVWDDATLGSSQPNSFVLASLKFQGLANGTSPLGFSPHPIFGNIDVKGLNASIINLTTEGGQLHVVPEPSTMILMGTGMLGLAFYSFKRRKTQQSD